MRYIVHIETTGSIRDLRAWLKAMGRRYAVRAVAIRPADSGAAPSGGGAQQGGDSG